MRYFLVTMSLIMTIIRLLKIYLNKNQREKGINDELMVYYSINQYSRWMSYESKRDRFIIVKTIFGFCLNCFFYLTSFYNVIHNLFPKNIILNSMGMIFIVYSIENLVRLIFDYYWHFMIERHFHMNKMTLKTFFLDEFKEFIIDIILMSLFIVFVHYVYQWFNIFGIVIVIGFIFLFIYAVQNHSLFILKLYNQFTPLEEGSLKNRIMQLIEDNGFHLKGIYIMDASKRTKRANAFCLGDSKKEICIDDNMLKYYSDDEILSVFAHELGHAVYNHSKGIKRINYLRIVILFMFAFVIFLDNGLYTEFGIKSLNYCMIMVILDNFMDIILFLLSIPYNQLMRRNELEADQFAVVQGYGKELKNVLVKLSSKSLSDMNPHPLVVKLTYTHPPLIDRLKNIEKN